jgi:hypothetical protein
MEQESRGVERSMAGETSIEPSLRAVSKRRPIGGDQRGKSSIASKTMWNFWLDTTMLVVFILMLWSATIVRFVFPPAVSAKDWTLWSWNVDQWIGFHYASLCGFTFLVVLHLMLHWSWVCGVVASRFIKRSAGKKKNVDDGTRTLWGVGLLIVLLNVMGIGIAAAVLMIQGPR